MARLDDVSGADRPSLPDADGVVRAPGIVVLGLGEVVWAAVVVGALAGPLLLAAEQWVAGAIAIVIGWPLARFGSRSLHRLAQRWLVFVPAGEAGDRTPGRVPAIIVGADERGRGRRGRWRAAGQRDAEDGAVHHAPHRCAARSNPVTH